MSRKNFNCLICERTTSGKSVVPIWFKKALIPVCPSCAEVMNLIRHKSGASSKMLSLMLPQDVRDLLENLSERLDESMTDIIKAALIILHGRVKTAQKGGGI